MRTLVYLGSYAVSGVTLAAFCWVASWIAGLIHTDQHGAVLVFLVITIIREWARQLRRQFAE